MKKDDFVKLLDSIIERKIKSIVPKMIKEELKNIKPIIAEKKKSDNLDISSLMAEENNTEAVPEQVEDSEKVYMKNPVLNKMLNETAGVMKKTAVKGSSYYDTDSLNEYKNVLDNEYTMNESDMAFASTDIVPQRRPVTTDANIKTEILKREMVQKTGGNEKIANAMIKDYRGLMKAVDKKSKGNRS